ncbi:MAG: glucuronate isomerase [Planctomycetota bacterium]|jgi:glucuronate isomerase|nr:glucuronate isomerase [Planctomycetota bacterium]
MAEYITEDFLLGNEPARRLYHEFAENEPIADYHCHFPPAELAENLSYDNIARMWLTGDHYKWRAMRALGEPERVITGDAGDREKFDAWARTVPFLPGNPMYHWTHMELKKPFGIADRLFGPDTADAVWEETRAQLGPGGIRVWDLLDRHRVRTICTTDDPADSLAHHEALAKSACPARVLPTLRPDKLAAAGDPPAWNGYMDKFAAAAGTAIATLDDFLAALDNRHLFFHEHGCRASDHALAVPYAAAGDRAAAEKAFKALRAGGAADPAGVEHFQAALLEEMARLDARRGWVMQLHLGAMRNLNRGLFKRLGPGAGGDAIADGDFARPLARFLGRVNGEDEGLPKIVLFTLNPAYNESLAAMAGCFQGDAVRGKVQFGSAWWFNDHKDGMTRQIQAAANLGVLAAFIGMLTDARGFLCFSRHEYFRRILCGLLGGQMASGELPADYPLVGRIVKDVSYRNACRYFGFAE